MTEKWMQSETLLHDLVFLQLMTIKEYVVYKYDFNQGVLLGNSFFL